jgi:dihydroflavonol-4-reductase
MSADVLVTGATGLIGRRVVARLLAEGRRVRVLARDPMRLGPDVVGRARVVEGDLLDGAAVARAVRGVGTVIHLAACARAWSRHPREFTSVNVDAVGLMLQASLAAGVERLVHVSTVLTLPWLRHPADSRSLTPYEETKLAGERLADRYAASGTHTVVVHPARVYGPGPLNDANGVTRLLAQYLHGPVAVRLDDGDVLANYVHVDDVAAGIILAAARGRRGAHYVLGGDNASLRELLALAAEVSGVRRRVVAVPRQAALAAAHAAALWGRLGGTVPITPAWVRCYLEDHRVDVADTCRELGYRYRPLRAGLEETILWLRTRLPAAS